MTSSSPARVVFSALFAEGDAFLDVFIRNFLLFTGPEALLVVNLPAGRSVTCGPAAASDRVHLINGRIVRAKLGHTLLAGHVESLRHAADRLGDFTHFCPMASNSLFHRRLDPAVLARDPQTVTIPYPASAPVSDLPDVWWWRTVREDGRLPSLLRTRWGWDTVFSFQIEGNLAAREDWMEVGRRLDQMLALPDLVAPPLPFPLEEILPATVFHNHGSGRHLRICHNHWERGPAAPMTVGDIASGLRRLEPEICMAKWFERSATDPATAAVSTAWSVDLLQDLSGPAGPATPDQSLIRRMLLEELGRALREREGFVPLGRDWEAQRVPGVDWMLPFRRTLPAGDHVVTLTAGLLMPNGDAAAYLVTETLDRPLELEIDIEPAAGRIRIGGGPPAGEADEALDAAPVPAGYLYVSPTGQGPRAAIRVTVPLPTTPAADSLLRLLVIRHAGRQGHLGERHRIGLPGRVETYHMVTDLDMSAGFWLGLPVFRGAGIAVTVEVL